MHNCSEKHMLISHEMAVAHLLVLGLLLLVELLLFGLLLPDVEVVGALLLHARRVGQYGGQQVVARQADAPDEAHLQDGQRH